ncbi:hypothetical protein ACWGNU_14580 [Paenibacillus lautus]
MTMKQRVTAAQLRELSDEQQQRLRDWWIPQQGDAYCYQELLGVYYAIDAYGAYVIHYTPGDGYSIEAFRNKHHKLRCLPLLSIGQMIELLRSKGYGVYMNTYEAEWEVVARKDGKSRVALAPDLCDVYWEIVKQIL